MKKTIFPVLLLLFSSIIFSQSLNIYKTDQTSVNFELSDIDSITFSLVSLAKALDLSSWKCMTTEPIIEEIVPAPGVYEKVAEGLKIYGNDNQINQAVHPVSISGNSIINKNIYVKWKAKDNGVFVTVTIDLYTDTTNWDSACRMTNLTVNSSSNGPDVISGDTWYYTRIAVTSNIAVSTTSTDNYDNNGGTIIQELSTNFSEPVKTFAFGINANKLSYVILGEARIE